MQYLSELFLDRLNGHYSDKNTLNALILCIEEMVSREEDIKTEEIRDLYDVCREFKN